jgi:uncharacterized membrane protein
MLSTDMLAITCGLSSAVAWGAGDFSGGFATKKGNLMGVVLFSQLLGGLLLLVTGVLYSQTDPTPSVMVWGGLAGICGVLGLLALYRGLASGRMGIVAPLSAVVTAILPLILALILEGLPKISQMVGFGLAIGAVWLISSTGSRGRIQREELTLSILAGLGFSLFFICIDRVSNEAIIWPLVACRAASVSMLTVVVLLTKGRIRLPARNQILFVIMAGIFDIVGNAFFALASHLGRLDLSVILASLYPASTIMLAWIFLKERLHHQQWVGVATAICALILIAA